MKKLFLLTLFSFLCIVSRSNTPEWLMGKWLGVEHYYEFRDSTVTYVTNGDVLSSGVFHIIDDEIISVDWEGNDCGSFLISMENETIMYPYSGNALIKFEAYKLPEKYSWIIGRWTDGQTVVSFSESELSVYASSMNLINRGFYVIEGSCINVYWYENKGYMDNYQLLSNSICCEGGEEFLKITDNAWKGGVKSIRNSFVVSKREYGKSIKWAYGKWYSNDGYSDYLFLTPRYYKAKGSGDANQNLNLDKLPKKKYSVVVESNKLLGLVVRVGDYYLDVESESIYVIEGLSDKAYLYKSEDYTSPVLGFLKWGMFVLLGLTLLIAIVVLFRKFYEPIKQKMPLLRDKASKVVASKISKVSHKFKTMYDDNEVLEDYTDNLDLLDGVRRTPLANKNQLKFTTIKGLKIPSGSSTPEDYIDALTCVSRALEGLDNMGNFVELQSVEHFETFSSIASHKHIKFTVTRKESPGRGKKCTSDSTRVEDFDFEELTHIKNNRHE